MEQTIDFTFNEQVSLSSIEGLCKDISQIEGVSIAAQLKANSKDECILRIGFLVIKPSYDPNFVFKELKKNYGDKLEYAGFPAQRTLIDPHQTSESFKPQSF